jgi:hypothetical protein
MMAWRRLDPNVPAVLAAIREPGSRTAILSPKMPTAVTRSTRSDQLLNIILNNDTVGAFMSSPPRYGLADQRPREPGIRLAFLSSSPTDAFGGHAYEPRVFWANRAGQADESGPRAKASEPAGLADSSAAPPRCGRE